MMSLNIGELKAGGHGVGSIRGVLIHLMVRRNSATALLSVGKRMRVITRIPLKLFCGRERLPEGDTIGDIDDTVFASGCGYDAEGEVEDCC